MHIAEYPMLFDSKDVSSPKGKAAVCVKPPVGGDMEAGLNR